MKTAITLAVTLLSIGLCGTSLAAPHSKKMIKRQVTCGSAFEQCMSHAFTSTKGYKQGPMILNCAVTSYKCRCNSGLAKTDKGCKTVY